ncbi:MAG: NAD(P)/FAD-dependent oxidoreductase [Chloroflexi bacterium]|nr:NAD(P)/FAD-dependent oxidoreductase [Chloroflexota bacterium]MBI3340370.1 NAD(P)/FAD-dependent oxidoreductase [Chloroflexota bacterium]
MDYDVIIAGGSFAGLAAAVQLRGKRVLMVEPHEIGAVQTSACGTLLAVLEATGTLDSLLQVHDHFVINLEDRPYEFPLLYPFCTFDFRIFCDRLFHQADVELVRASVLGHQDHTVHTTQGAFEAEILMDATGWRAELATNARRRAEPHTGKSFGLETVVPLAKQGLHFHYDRRKLGGYNVGWLFPTGEFSRIGFGSYRGETRLNMALKDYAVEYFGNSPDGIHGGYWPYRRQPSVTGNVFRIGDSAGQCLPLSGEGIRPALFFGALAGSLARRVLEGETSLPDALEMYRERNNRRHFAAPHYLLLAAQKIVPALPIGWMKGIAGAIRRPENINPLMQLYWKVINPHALAQLWRGVGSSVPVHLQTSLEDPERSAL